MIESMVGLNIFFKQKGIDYFSQYIDRLRFEIKLRKVWDEIYPVRAYILDVAHYLIYEVPYFIISIPNKIKYFIQRGVRGFSDGDVWGFDIFLSNVIVGGIKQLRKDLHGHPSDLTFKKWKKILKQIEDGFELIKKYDFISLNYYIKNEKLYKKFRKKFKESIPTKLEIKKMDKSFDLLKEHYSDLWD